MYLFLSCTATICLQISIDSATVAESCYEMQSGRSTVLKLRSSNIHTIQQPSKQLNLISSPRFLLLAPSLSLLNVCDNNHVQCEMCLCRLDNIYILSVIGALQHGTSFTSHHTLGAVQQERQSAIRQDEHNKTQILTGHDCDIKPVIN